MKSLVLAIVTLLSAAVPMSAITVKAPSNGAQLESPFLLTASTLSCASKSAVSMGYSIDHGPTTIVPTSFTASVTAPLGSHILHVKCWGVKVNNAKLLSITIVKSVSQPPAVTAPPSFVPPAGTYSAAQTVTLASSTADATIYYTTDGSDPTTASPEYKGAFPVDASMVINAIAIAPGDSQSSLVTASYDILPTGPVVPSGAIAVDEIQAMPNWLMHHDPGTSGDSQGTMTIVNDPSLSGQAAQFSTTFEDWGGEIYSKSYDNDPYAENFLYDNYVWIEAGSVVGNLEMDNNQVLANGDTIIYAFQCAGDHGTWDYTSNVGTPARPIVKWNHSNQPCNPANWSTNTWHHVQIGASRDDEGNVTYQSVWLDGVAAPINETVPSAFALGWKIGDLMTNFQVDGAGANGTSVVYADKLTFYRW